MDTPPRYDTDGDSPGRAFELLRGLVSDDGALLDRFVFLDDGRLCGLAFVSGSVVQCVVQATAPLLLLDVGAQTAVVVEPKVGVEREAADAAGLRVLADPEVVGAVGAELRRPAVGAERARAERRLPGACAANGWVLSSRWSSGSTSGRSSVSS